MTKEETFQDLQKIPGIGKAMAKDLYDLGYRQVKDLKGENPEKMYDYLNQMFGYRLDPCVLYTFRCAVYFASENNHKPELLKWWNWKDK